MERETLANVDFFYLTSPLLFKKQGTHEEAETPIMKPRQL
ncbi:hypothetical protein COO91_09065 [Nostoc flagelliforme CCNUN1]|uniref:Uncharacterized protein n=1 Tax=Nostoc flagelliforme CCNUN1 TaxID=2038116 RepID=A0A2K8T5D3_9NOSO|nr:hypothetical protein COO91_09065 [Nostoc flagelliforme CCNUN1]